MKKFILLSFALLVSAIYVKAQTEVEPNGTILQNTASNTFTAPVTIGATITTTPDDRDFFKIDLPYCSTWSFNLLNPSGDPVVLKMYLYNAQNTSSVIINSSGITFDFTQGIPNPVVLNCGQSIYIQIDQTSGLNLGAYSLQVIETPYAGYECNNSFGSAQQIPTDTSIIGKIWGYDCGGLGDKDFYKIVSAECGVHNISISGINPNQRLVIELFDSLFNSVNGIVSSAVGANVSLATLISEGTYYIQISEWTGSCCSPGYNVYNLEDDPFTITTNFDVSDVAECNNTFQTAYPIPLNTTFDAKLWGSNSLISDGQIYDRNEDQDFYEIVSTQCGVHNISISGINPNQRLVIEVFDSLFNSVNGVVSSAVGANVSLATLISEGTYYIQISEWTGSCCSPGYNVYNLEDDPFTITTNFDVSDVAECNNTFQTAYPIPLNTTFDAKLWGSNSLISDGQIYDRNEDQDFYEIVSTQCGVHNISISGINPNQRLVIEIFDSLFNSVNSVVANAVGANVSLATVISDGLYYLKISEWIGSCCSPGYNVYNLEDDSFTITTDYSPYAIITSSNDSICSGDSLSFTSSATNVTSWLWNFGSLNSPSSSTIQNPQYVVFNNVGQNVVTLSANGCSIDTILVEVYPATPTPTITNSGLTLTSSSSTGNQWYFNNNIIPNATSSIYLATQNGTYYVCVSSPSSCGNPCSDTIIISSVGVNELDFASSFSVYPNPSKDNLTIEFSKQNNLQSSVSIVNLLGEKLYQEKFLNQSKLTIDIRDYPVGIYFVQIENEKGRITKKFIKE